MTVAERELPHDLAAERALISAALLDGDAYALIADRLTPWRFYSESHRRTWEAIGQLENEGHQIDIVTVAGKLQDNGRLAQVGGRAALAEIVDAVPAIGHVEDYAERVLSLSRLRELISRTQTIAAEGYGVRGDIQEFIDRAENSIFEIAHTAQSRDIEPISEACKESWENITAAAERRGAVEFPTGLTRLDYKLALRRQEVTTIAARPGMGKTSLLLKIAMHLAEQGLVVALFSLEMPRHQLATRAACMRAKLDLHRVMQGFIRTDEWAALSNAKSEIARLPIWIDDTPSASLLHMRAGGRKVKAKAGRLDLLGLDYIQLMGSIGDADSASREQEISTNMRGTKRCARELNVPVIALSQLNRDLEKRPDKRPQLSDLRESGAIEQDSDNVVFVYRPEYYAKEKTEEDDRGVAELDVAKQRNGPTGKVRVHFDAPTTTFSNLQIEGDSASDPQEQFEFDSTSPEAQR